MLMHQRRGITHGAGAGRRCGQSRNRGWKWKSVLHTVEVVKPVVPSGCSETWLITVSLLECIALNDCEKLGLRCKQERRFRATTDSRRTLPTAPNLLSQDFAASGPNKVWTADITYIATEKDWLYLAGLKDLFSGELVGYAMDERMTRHLVMQALFRAVATRRLPLDRSIIRTR
jgi:transposase InsO family protein